MKKRPGEEVRAAGILLISHAESIPQFLLMKHPKRWDLPKGHAEEGESMEETALRETEEETGIQPELIQLDPDFRFELSYEVTYKKTGSQVFQKTVHYFLGHLETKPELRLTEHDSAEWFDWEPPHSIQTNTIDPLLAAIDAHFPNGLSKP